MSTGLMPCMLLPYVLVLLLAPCLQSAAAATVTGFYTTKLEPWAGGLVQGYSGFAELTTYSDNTAQMRLAVFNITDLISAHIHRLPDGAQVVWCMPADPRPAYETTLGTKNYSDIPPLSGDFTWTFMFDSSFFTATANATFQGSGWAGFVDQLSQSSMYVNVHTVKDPSGSTHGTLRPAAANATAMPEPEWPMLSPPEPVPANNVSSTYNITLTPATGVDTNATGYFLLQFFDNQTAHFHVVVNNIKNMTQAHIHLITSPAEERGPIIMWCLPLTADPELQNPLGTLTQHAIPPLSGTLAWAAPFNVSLLELSPDINTTDWSHFRNAAAVPGLLYFQIHTLGYPAGELLGFLTPPPGGSLTSPPMSGPGSQQAPSPSSRSGPPPQPQGRSLTSAVSRRLL